MPDNRRSGHLTDRDEDSGAIPLLASHLRRLEPYPHTATTDLIWRRTFCAR